jgi:hypothetical protein
MLKPKDPSSVQDQRVVYSGSGANIVAGMQGVITGVIGDKAIVCFDAIGANILVNWEEISLIEQ